MKKWLKVNYKYYLIFFVVLVGIMIRNIFEYTNPDWIENIFNIGTQNIYYKLMDVVGVYSIRNLFLSFYSKLLILGFILLHGVMLWGERNKSEREFLETLPIKRDKIVAYRAIMDITVATTSIVLVVVVNFLYMKVTLAEYSIELPWLLSALTGVGITLICYTVMIIGIMYFIESLVVRGDLKVVATAASMAMIYGSMNLIYETFMYSKDNIFNTIMGYIKMYLPGGNIYMIEKYDYYVNNAWWQMKRMFYTIVYEGKEYTLSTTGGMGYYSMQEGIIGFKEVNLYIWYALSYLLIGSILIGLGVHLTKKQDLSKQGFYFKFGNVMIGGLFAIAIFSLFLVSSIKMWYVAVIASIIGFALFMYITNRRKIIV